MLICFIIFNFFMHYRYVLPFSSSLCFARAIVVVVVVLEEGSCCWLGGRGRGSYCWLGERERESVGKRGRVMDSEGLQVSGKKMRLGSKERKCVRKREKRKKIKEKKTRRQGE